METLGNRRVEIEWLRIIAVLLLFPFHTAMIFFSREDFYVKLSPPNPILDYIVLFLTPWHMPLLFFIAGIASFYSLQSRTTKEYIIERTKRLFIPFVFGLLTIALPQSYLAYIFRNTDKSVSDFIRFYFNNLLSDLTGYKGTFTPAHLWFILYLYIYSIISAKGIKYLLNVSQNTNIKKNLSTLISYGIILFYPIVIGTFDQLPTLGTKNPFYYFCYFIIGVFILLIHKSESVIYQKRLILICIGILTMSLYLLLIDKSFVKYSLEDILFYILRRYNAWIWVLIVYSLGEYLKRISNSVLSYLSEASYPIYLLHQTIIVIVGYTTSKCVSASSITIFLIVLIISISLTFLIYHMVVRKVAIARLLFGMKLSKSSEA